MKVSESSATKITRGGTTFADARPEVGSASAGACGRSLYWFPALHISNKSRYR